ncbi:hypothetical protein [Nitrosomonas sp.]|uniref:hypothetical protein n=1 Tax=Nitrosomonas sp. TaxID=42353 RepID=UPI0026151BB0|nr:hypothetical protein [Nitrosomonas sp.]MCW5602570.1 hypothetical protein [Nitrosomonas sp.]
MNEVDILNNLTLFAGHLQETIFLVLGAAMALLAMYLRDYRLSQHTDKSYLWYLFEADRKKTDDVIVILLTLVGAEIVTGALTGLSPSQLIIVGIGLGVATKVRAGGDRNEGK